MSVFRVPGRPRKISGECPDCYGPVLVPRPALGRKLGCPHCHTLLQIVDVDDLELRAADAILDSWFDDDPWDDRGLCD